VHPALGEAVVAAEHGGNPSVVAAHTAVGGEPEKAVAIFEDGDDRAVDQPVAD
jgi:hypothetical protein